MGMAEGSKEGVDGPVKPGHDEGTAVGWCWRLGLLRGLVLDCFAALAMTVVGYGIEMTKSARGTMDCFAALAMTRGWSKN
jgi:hypothetical protein